MLDTRLDPTVEAAGEGGAADRPALRRCTAIAPDDFATRVFAREASLSRADELGRDFSDLFSIAAADAVLSRQGLRTPFVRVAKDGVTLPESGFTWAGGVGATVADQVSDVRLAKLFAEGSTVVLQALHRTHAPIAEFAQALGSELGHPVQVNAYITPPQSQGFSDHYDVHDVFVLQIAGQKQWRIHAPVLKHPLRTQPWTDRRAAVEAAAGEPPVLDVVMRPGDALYLPRGYLHAATALGDTSVHLTVGVHVWTRRHLVEQVMAAMTDVETLRATLPLGVDVTDADSLRGELAATLHALADAVGTVDAERVTAGLTRQALAAARAAPLAPLAQARAVAEVDATTRLRWRASLRALVREHGDQVVVTTQDGVCRLPAWIVPALDRLRAGAELAVAELGQPAGQSTIGEADLLMAARVLLSDALVVPV